MDLKTEQYIIDLDNLKLKIDGVDDDEIKSSLIKLFCVRVSGLLEVFLKTRISEYSNGKVPKEINRFLTSKFKDITNLKTSKLQEVLTAFSTEWAKKFTDYIEKNEQIKTSLDSIIAQRHSIAHGQSSNLGEIVMNQYYDDIKQVVCFLDGVIR